MLVSLSSFTLATRTAPSLRSRAAVSSIGVGKGLRGERGRHRKVGL